MALNYSLFFISICQQMIFDPFIFVGINQWTIFEILTKSTFGNPQDIYHERCHNSGGDTGSQPTVTAQRAQRASLRIATYRIMR